MIQWAGPITNKLIGFDGHWVMLVCSTADENLHPKQRNAFRKFNENYEFLEKKSTN
jgi:hypothetical protein